MRSRPARVEDYEAFARLFPELGSGDPVPPRSWWDSTLYAKTLFIEESSHIVGYGLSDPYGESAHVSQIVVAPAWRGRGVGREIMSAVADRLRSAGCSRWQLNVKEGNTPAIRLYESFGFRVAYRAHAFKVTRQTIHALPHRAALPIRPITPEDDAGLEAHFQLAGGQITKRRAGAVRPIHRLAAENGAVAGMVVGDAAFPGVPTIRVAGIDIAGALLREFAEHVDARLHEIHVFVEDNEALSAALRDAGATPKFIALHMKGEIPLLPVHVHQPAPAKP